MTKIKNFVTKHDNLFVFLLFLLISIGFVFKNKIYGFDSLWLFGNTYKLANGLKIYEEVNILTFPFFYELFQLILRLFNNFLGFLLSNFLLAVPLYFMIYQVFKSLNIKKSFALLFTLACSLITPQLFIFGPSYNTFSLLLYVIGLFLYLKKKDSKYSYIFQGLIAFLILMCDQKFGAAYIAGLFLICVSSLKSEKKPIINLVKTYLVIAFLCLVTILVLFLTNRLNSFINLTILSIGSFTQNLSLGIISALYLLGIGIFFILVIVCIVKKYNNYKPLKTLLCLTFPLLIIVYPIFNHYHFILFFTLFFILVFYTLYNLFDKLLVEKTLGLVVSIVNLLFSLLLIFNSILTFINWNSTRIKTPGDLFYGAVIYDSLKVPLEETNNYINSLKEQNINYRILSIHSMFYTLYDVPEKNNSYFDLPLRGNLGKDNWHALSNILDQEPEGTYIIIDRKIDGDFLMYQFPEEIFNYVNENYQYIEDVGFYSVYIK